MPELSIVIPTHRRAAILASSLAALARQDLAPDRFEAIVVADSESNVLRRSCLTDSLAASAASLS